MRIKLFISVLDNIEWGCLRPLRRIFPLVSSVNWVIHCQTSCRHQVQSIITPLYNIFYGRNIMLLLYVIYLHFKQTFNQRRNYFLSACKVLGLGFHNLHLIPSFLCCCKLFVWGHVYELLPETQTIKQWEWLAQYATTPKNSEWQASNIFATTWINLRKLWRKFIFSFALAYAAWKQSEHFNM